MKMNKKRVQTHVLEQIMFCIMIVFVLAGIWIFAVAYMNGIPFSSVAIFLILIIVILSIFMQTIVMIRIYQQKCLH